MMQDLREAVAAGKMQGYQWLIVGLCFLLNVLDGFDVLVVAFTAVGIKEHFGLTNLATGYLLSASTIGMTAASFIIAPFADRFGRRPVLLFAVALSALGMVASAYAGSIEALRWWRGVTGLGVGGILVCTNVLTSEYTARKWRGLAIGIYAAGFGVGGVLGGWGSVYLQEQYGWQSVFLAGAGLTAAVGALVMLLMPESIDFLLTRQPANAKVRLAKIAARIGKTGSWALPAAGLQPARSSLPFAALFKPPYLQKILLMWPAFLCIMFCFYFLASWTPALLQSAGLAPADSKIVNVWLVLGGALGSVLYGAAGRFVQPRVLCMLCAGLAIAAIWLFSAVFHQLALAIVLGVVIGALVNGCIAALYTINPELFAGDIRSTGVGAGIGVGRLGAIISPIIAGSLTDAGWTGVELYRGVTAVLLVAVIALWFLPHGRKA